MGYFSDFKAINKVVAKKTIGTYFGNLLLIPVSALYLMVYYLFTIFIGMTIGRLGAPGSFIGGLMSWMFMCAVLSDFLSHLDDIIVSRRFKLRNVGKHYNAFFMPLLSATAIPNIIIYLFFMLTRIPLPYSLVIIVYALFATPEVVYQKQIDRIDLFVYGYNYFKENWMLWLPLNVIFGVGIFFINKFLLDISLFVPFIRGLYLSSASFGLSTIIAALYSTMLLAVPLLFVMIYRGYLFKILSVSSRRKREYMRNIYGK